MWMWSRGQTVATCCRNIIRYSWHILLRDWSNRINFCCIKASWFYPSAIFNSNLIPGTSDAHVQWQQCCRQVVKRSQLQKLRQNVALKFDWSPSQFQSHSHIMQNSVKGWPNDRTIFLQLCWTMLRQNFATVWPKLNNGVFVVVLDLQRNWVLSLNGCHYISGEL